MFRWDWRQNMPGVPSMTLFGNPSIEPLAGDTVPTVGVPFRPAESATRIMTQGDPGVGPGMTPEVTMRPGETGTAIPGSVPTMGFGDPNMKKATAATQAEMDTFKYKLTKMMENKDFGPALAALAKGMGGAQKIPPPQLKPMRLDPVSFQPDRSAAGAGALKSVKSQESTDLRRKAVGEQSNYDILAAARQRRRRRDDD